VGETLNLTKGVPKNGAPAAPQSGDVEHLDLIGHYSFSPQTVMNSRLPAITEPKMLLMK
jgi:hypothetical protein